MSSVNSTKITGLATGLDTDSMIQSMLATDQEKIDNVKAEEQKLQWQQEIYRDLIGDIQDFQSKYLSVTSSSSILNSANWNTVSVSSSNSNVITATGTAGADNVNYKFEVNKLAETASVKTDSISNKNQSLKEIGLSGTVEFQLRYGNGDTDVTETITLDENDTVSSMIEKINKASGGKVKASYSDMTGNFTLETSKTGSNSTLQVVSSDGKSQSDALDFLGLKTKDGLDFSSTGETVVSGSNTDINVMDSAGNLIRNLQEENNTFTIDGIKYNVNSTGKADINSKTDVSNVVENMKNFIEDYNKILDKAYKLSTEKADKNYQPLTDAQKKEMSEDEIKKWEENAKKGLLRSDRDLSNFVSDLQKTIFGSAENISFLSEIGITSPSDYNKKGQLCLDESKFIEALETKGDEVYKKLVGNSDSIFESTKKTLDNYVGKSSSVFAQKAGIENTTSYTNNYYSEKLKKQAELIKTLTDKMTKKENALYKKFANLETTMNSLNSQMQIFAQV